MDLVSATIICLDGAMFSRSSLRMKIAVWGLQAAAVIAALCPTPGSAAPDSNWGPDIGYNFGGPFACPGRDLTSVGTVRLQAPIPPRQDKPQPVIHRLKFSNSGKMTFDGNPTDLMRLPDQLQIATSEEHAVVTIFPDAHTPFYQVVAAIELLNQLKFCDFVFAGNEQYIFPKSFSKLDAIASGLAYPPIQPFAKQTDAAIMLDFGTSLAQSEKRKTKRPLQTCRALLNTQPVTEDEFFERLSHLLYIGIKQLGGIEGARAESSKGLESAAPSVIIQAKPQLPWMCAGAAMFYAQSAGYQIVDLVLLPE